MVTSEGSAACELTLLNFLQRARKLFGKKEIVSREEDGSIFRYTYADFYKRVCQLANALEELGVGKGDRVGTLAWNTHRHLELYFAPACMGAAYHTINLRLSAEQITYVINHAEDRVLFLDSDQIPVVEQIADRLNVKHFIVMGKEKSYDTSFDSIAYEELISGRPKSYDWPELDENAVAGMAYTSGTTGLPKGVEYTHRNIVLHSIVTALPDALNLSEKRCVLHIVPMFHVNAWGIPFAATMCGAKQVFPGQHPRPEDYVELIQNEKVDFTACVPTVWFMIYNFLKENPGYDISSLKEAFTGGSAPPASLLKAFREEFGVTIVHTYGLTETTPVLTVNRPKSYMKLEGDEFYEHSRKQGLLLPLLEMKVVGEKDGELGEVEWNGMDMGELYVRGPWVTREYYRDPEKTAEKFIDGWFRTEDIVVVDEEGYIKIVDRAKDLIKSGGEWISSLDMENHLMLHPAVKEAVVIGIAHPKWQERPLAFVVPEGDVMDREDREKLEKLKEELKEELMNHLRKKFPKWWLPDDIIFVTEIPKTSVGKFDKKVLREKYGDYFTIPQRRPS
jgi:fatty-acyl-CoA synthase